MDADLDVELEEYEPSDSEDGYSEDEKLLLENVRKRRKDFDDESEEEVLGFASDDDDDEEDDDGEADDMASDLDGEQDDDLPDVKAWGRKKKNFYNTDYVDDDYGGFQKEEEEEAARLEEEEARSIQQRLARQLRDDDFGLDAFLAEDKKDGEKAEGEEVIATDLTKLSKRQKLSLVQKESPEFFALTRDFSEKMAVLKDELQPVAALVKADKIPDCPAARFVTSFYRLILNYCGNVSFYLLLKALRLPVAAHPVVGRLAKYRRLLAQADAVYRDSVRPQLPRVLAADWDAVAAAPSAELQEKKKKNIKKKKALRLLSAPRAEDAASDESGTDREGDPAPRERKKRKAELPEAETAGAVEAAKAPTATVGAALRALADSSGEEDSDDGRVDDGESGEGGERRAITYEMAKNKGLTPYRKKELRNPRVRHRRKYERARVRRKGQVREPRKEVKKYGGEVSGIKIGVTKSIKLKV